MQMLAILVAMIVVTLELFCFCVIPQSKARQKED